MPTTADKFRHRLNILTESIEEDETDCGKSSETVIGKNKAGYTAGQSRMVGQERKSKNHLRFKNVMDGLTDGPIDTVRERVACPRLKKPTELENEKLKEKKDKARYTATLVAYRCEGAVMKKG